MGSIFGDLEMRLDKKLSFSRSWIVLLCKILNLISRSVTLRNNLKLLFGNTLTDHVIDATSDLILPF